MNNSTKRLQCFGRTSWFIVLFILFLLINPLFVKSSQARSLTLTQIKQLIKTKSPDSLVANIIKKRGLAFKPFKEVINELRDIGAGPQTLQELRRLEPLLEEAKRDIPDIINKIFSALSQGEPDKVKGYFSSDIYNSKTLDAICQPFCKQTHYIESIAERPGNKYDVRLRVLFQSAGERAYFLVFQSTQDTYVLESMYDVISGYSDGYSFFGAPQDIVNDWFGTWEENAKEISRKFIYAIKVNNQDALHKLVSSPHIADSLINSNLYKLIQQYCVNKIDTPDIADLQIVSFNGIKAYVETGYINCDANITNAEYFGNFKMYFWIDKVNDEYKIVACKMMMGYSQGLDDTKWEAEDPAMELRTLKRFSAATPGDEAKVKEMEALMNVKVDEVYGMIYDYKLNESGKYLIANAGDEPQIFPKIRVLSFDSDHDVQFNWDGNYSMSGDKICFNIQNLQIKLIQHHRETKTVCHNAVLLQVCLPQVVDTPSEENINPSDYSSSQDIPQDYQDIGLGYHVKLKNATFENGKSEGAVFIYRTTQSVPNEIRGCVKIIPTTSSAAQTTQKQTNHAKVNLKNGTVLEGDIEETDASHIKLKTSYGVLNIKSSDIKTIEYEKPAQQQSSNTTN
ncbi:MAG: hypothetical protein M1381_11910 [Deltaproteobacteria bacterium]|nr:hypothetical protein [Deltaproteobacteria bacterium]